MPTGRGNTGIAIGVSFTTISLGILFARLYTRFVLVRNSGVEEIAIIFAWVSQSDGGRKAVETPEFLTRHTAILSCALCSSNCW